MGTEVKSPAVSECFYSLFYLVQSIPTPANLGAMEYWAGTGDVLVNAFNFRWGSSVHTISHRLSLGTP